MTFLNYLNLMNKYNPLCFLIKFRQFELILSFLCLKLVSRIEILLKNNSSRYNFLSKITRTDVALGLNSQNAQRVKYSYILLLLIVGACKSDPEKNLFTEVLSSHSKIDFENTLEDSKSLNALDYMYFYDGGGVSVGDINNDGLPDIYFTANKVANKLYLNKGNFIFEDITIKAGVSGQSDWNTGTVMADVNGDGLLDIYVCAVVGILGFEGHNELFINNGDLTFSEKSADYNLNIQSQANNAAFFDYDKDGDLDMYLLNEGKHSAESFGPAKNRLIISEGNGDRLLRNDDGKFINVSQSAGIYSGTNSYGLGVAVADFNNDGWDDLYISNDFHEDDYYYINNKNGTFSEQLKSHFGKISRYSMGNDVADVNHDGYPDVITLDMMPNDEKTLKSTLNNNDIPYHKLRQKLGYYPQFSRNMLQINQKGSYFTEVALYSEIAATDWSWAPLLADFNQDGELDLFVSNGIYRRLNDLDYLQILTEKASKRNLNTSRLFDQKALEKMPKAAVHNYIYKGTKKLKFEDKSGIWFPKNPTESSGSAYADLDNDGDLDLIINNYNTKPSILKNNSSTNSYLKLNFKTTTKNKFAIGTKVVAYTNGQMQLRQLYTTRGFQSGVAPVVYFGFENTKKIDSLRIIWPDNTSQLLVDVITNQNLTITPSKNRKPIDYSTLFKTTKPWFKTVSDSNFNTIKHIENNSSEFVSNPLLPYGLSKSGPAFSFSNQKEGNSTLLFLGGATHHKSQLFIIDSLGIQPKITTDFDEDLLSEDVDATFFDADNDGDDDLFVVSGGNEFRGKSKSLKDRIYFNDGKNNFTKSAAALPEYFENGSFIRINDIDKDGDIDLFVGGRSIAKEFGKSPRSYLLLNDGSGKFEIAKSILTATIGMLTDAVFTDFNNDGFDDLIVVGEWMSPQFFKNNKGNFVNVTKSLSDENNTGLWQAIQPFDMDGDGDTDYLLGNWGLNTKFKASKKEPLKMLIGDLLKNDKWLTLLSFAKNETYYSINTKEELQQVLGSSIDTKFKSYKAFAGKNFDQIINKKIQARGILKTVQNLSSGYLENINGSYTFKAFNETLQLSPITCFSKDDFNKDGLEEVLIAGNLFEVPPFHGKLDGNLGSILHTGGKITSGLDLGLAIGNKQIKQINTLRVGNENYLIVVINNDKTLVYKY